MMSDITEVTVKEENSIEEKEEGFTVKRILWLLFVIILFCVVIPKVASKWFSISLIPSGSMEPTIDGGSLVFVDRKDKENINRGDIVIFKSYNGKNFCKRIIGLPGDEIHFVNGVTYVNNEPLDEPYIKEKNTVADTDTYIVPQGRYFVMGDNRNNSNDSRKWDEPYIKKEDIKGKVTRIIFPFSKMQKLTTPSYRER